MIEKDLDLCGIGNGLVDIQIEVEDDVIKDFGLNKGEMQLVDIEQQKSFIAKISDRKLNMCSGGSAANTIIAFSQFGGKSAYTTVLGMDDFGKFYSDEFLQLEIELSAKLDEQDPTGTCLVLISPDSERTMATSLGASAKFTKEDVSEAVIKRSKWLYIEGYEFSQQESSDAVYRAVELAKKHDTKIAVTFSDVFITDIFYDNLKKAVDNADLIFCNEAEAINYTKTKDWIRAIVSLVDIVPNFVITKGAKGSIVKWNNEMLEIPSYPAKPIDSTGAGDMYAAGFMYGIIYKDSPEKAGHLASLASAKVVSQLGARIDEDLVELIINSEERRVKSEE